MNTVTKEGEQPRRCIVEQCDRPPAAGDVLCPGHLKTHSVNGTAVTPPIIEPDDPELIERTARQAAIAEEQEYAERRRVKSWKTLETGARVPDEFFTDEELARIEAEVAQAFRYASRVTTPSHSWEFDPQTGEHIAPDPVKAQLKILKRALRGKLGPAPKQMVESLTEFLENQS